MPTLVHIADEKNSADILRAGIRTGKRKPVVYFMPVVKNHLVSHQWLRELRRGGAKVLVGVYFRLSSDEMVWAGYFAGGHRQMRLGDAIRELDSFDDALGYEIFIERKITPAEIQGIRHIPQGIGWRYMPHSHQKHPCICPSCFQPGTIKANRLRVAQGNTYRPPKTPYFEIKQRIALETEKCELQTLFYSFLGKKRRVDPSFLEPFMQHPDIDVVHYLATALGSFRHPKSKEMLRILAGSPDPDVASEALWNLQQFEVQKAAADEQDEGSDET
jgi:hypothetical protein